jgi:hypothetical protein
MYSMGSSEPLGTPCLDYIDTQESDTAVVNNDYQEIPSLGDGTSDAPGIGIRFVAPPTFANAARNRKRSILGEEDVVHVTYMIEAVKAVAVAITNDSPPDVYPTLYAIVMDARVGSAPRL